jgi:hypothetical protein
MKKFFLCLAMLMNVEQVFATIDSNRLHKKVTEMTGMYESLLPIIAHNIANIRAPTFPEIPDLIIQKRTVRRIFEGRDSSPADSSDTKSSEPAKKLMLNLGT